jgi:hypothetical protein
MREIVTCKNFASEIPTFTYPIWNCVILYRTQKNADEYEFNPHPSALTVTRNLSSALRRLVQKFDCFLSWRSSAAGLAPGAGAVLDFSFPCSGLLMESSSLPVKSSGIDGFRSLPVPYFNRWRHTGMSTIFTEECLAAGARPFDGRQQKTITTAQREELLFRSGAKALLADNLTTVSIQQS